MEEISKAKQALFRRLSDKKFRYESGLCAAEGFKCISDCVRFGWRPEWIAVESKQAEQVKLWAADRFPLYLLSDSRLSFLDNPSGLLAVFSIPKPVALTEGPVVVLDGIQDPGNLGTILRTCHWFGVQHIVLLKGTVDPFAPKVIQASMGSVAASFLHTLDVAELKAWKEQHQIQFLIAALEGESLPIKKQPLNLNQIAWVIGSEGRGVRPEIAELGDSFSIPYFGSVEAPESLNAAAALAVILGRHFMV